MSLLTCRLSVCVNTLTHLKIIYLLESKSMKPKKKFSSRCRKYRTKSLCFLCLTFYSVFICVENFLNSTKQFKKNLKFTIYIQLSEKKKELCLGKIQTKLFIGRIHLPHLQIRKYFMDNSSINFHDSKVFQFFLQKIRKK